MSISRRGLIAAGLAIAAVGAVGVTSTLNAGAAQIAEPTTTTSTSAVTDGAAARRGLLAPPPGLPGGGQTTTGGKARGALSAQGVTAAEATEMGPPLEVEPVYAPKGLPGFPVPRARAVKPRVGVSALSAEAASATASAVAPADKDDPVYYYAQGSQVAESNGSTAFLQIGKPYLAAKDEHSLAEIAVRSADGKQTVEVGWTVDRLVNKGSDQPHLFVYHWVDGSDEETCYNGCGWVQHHDEIEPGMQLTPGTTKRFSIQHSGKAWWIGYDNKWMGYFPDDQWKGSFTKAGAVQWFGELAVHTPRPCTDMGNAIPAADERALSITRMSLYGGPPVSLLFAATNSSWYSVSEVKEDVPEGEPPVVVPNSLRYGGSGAC